jgi:hypothetical protein
VSSSRAALAAPALVTGPFLFGARTDLLAFTGSAVVALALVALRRALGWSEELPEWAFLVFVLGIDVAHVYATLFRTYLDSAELRRHPARYLGIPLGVYVAGVALHLMSGAVFFRVLAYLAVAHFVRQQVGWAALYRARAPASRTDALIDSAAIYAATGYPLLVWHAHLGEKHFAWLVAGDFVDVSTYAARLLPAGRALWFVALALFAGRQLHVAWSWRRVDVGKTALVVTTAVTWYVGIVGSSGDFDFTVTNVITHGVPYMVLLYSYGKAVAPRAPRAFAGHVVARGAVAFVALLVGCAILEEYGWDRVLWHDHEWLFGAGEFRPGHLVAALFVPLLALPQATHYLLDGLLWRRREPALQSLGDWLSVAPGKGTLRVFP